MSTRTVNGVSRDSADLSDLQAGDKVAIDGGGWDVMGPAREGWVAVRPHGGWGADVTVARVAEIAGVVTRCVESDGFTHHVHTDYLRRPR